MRAIIDTEKQADTGAYSPGVLVDGWLYVSGQGPLDLGTGAVVSGTIESETLLTLRHVARVVKAAGGHIRNIVKCTVHLADIADFDRFNSAYKQFFDGDIMPARTTVQSGLADGIKVEIDAVAFVGRYDQ